MKGIDVSEFQGQIDWEAVKSEIDFVMIRAGFGAGVSDSMFATNIAECNRLGIPCGAYWFSYAVTEAEAAAEAQAAVEAAKPYRLSYPIAFDWEYDSVRYAKANGVDPDMALASALCVSFCRTVAASGYTPMNYASPDFLLQYYDDSTLEFPLWLAEWGPRITYANPKADIWIWQYGQVTVNGISGEVDGDQLLKGDDYMTGEEIYNALNDYLKELGLPTSWNAASELQKAVNNGITDGSNPTEFCQRYEAAIMANRALEKALNEK